MRRVATRGGAGDRRCSARSRRYRGAGTGARAVTEWRLLVHSTEHAMPIRSIRIRVVAAAAFPIPIAAAAHHGWSGYDSSNVLNMEGTIREAGYEHPHGYVRLETPG